MQAQRPRHAVDQRDHVDAEAGLHLGVLVELVEHDLAGSPPRFSSITSRIPERSDSSRRSEISGDLLLADEVGDLRDQPAVAALLDHERELGDDDRLLAALERLDVGLGAQPAPSRGRER